MGVVGMFFFASVVCCFLIIWRGILTSGKIEEKKALRGYGIEPPPLRNSGRGDRKSDSGAMVRWLVIGIAVALLLNSAFSSRSAVYGLKLNTSHLAADSIPATIHAEWHRSPWSRVRVSTDPPNKIELHSAAHAGYDITEIDPKETSRSLHVKLRAALGTTVSDDSLQSLAFMLKGLSLAGTEGVELAEQGMSLQDSSLKAFSIDSRSLSDMSGSIGTWLFFLACTFSSAASLWGHCMPRNRVTQTE